MTRFEKESYIILDYIILDLKSKMFFLYDNRILDSFIDHIHNIEKIVINNREGNKEIKIFETNSDSETIIIVNSFNQMISFKNSILTSIEDYFLSHNKFLIKIQLLRVQTIGHHFLEGNKVLRKIELPQVQTIGTYFLMDNKVLKEIELRQVQTIGHHFLAGNEVLRKIELPQVQTIGDFFLPNNEFLNDISFPQVKFRPF